MQDNVSVPEVFAQARKSFDRMERWLCSEEALSNTHSELEEVWLDPSLDDPGKLAPLLRPYSGGDMAAHPVSRQVNAPAYDAPDCIAPLEAN